MGIIAAFISLALIINEVEHFFIYLLTFYFCTYLVNVFPTLSFMFDFMIFFEMQDILVFISSDVPSGITPQRGFSGMLGGCRIWYCKHSLKTLPGRDVDTPPYSS